MTSAEHIVAAILKAKPCLPDESILHDIAFQWNDDELDGWDGGKDLHEMLREEVILSLRSYFEKQDQELAEALRYLLRQEIDNCSQAALSMPGLRVCYDQLAALKHYEDLELLMEALTCSFDASLGLFKNRLFYLGHENVLNYLKQKGTNSETMEQFEYYATIED